MEKWNQFPIWQTTLYMCLNIHHILVLITVRRFMKGSSFFFLFFVTGCFDVYYCYTLTTYNIFKNTMSGPIYIWLSQLNSTSLFFGLFNNLFGNCMMAINRFCATFLFYEKYWTQCHIISYFSITATVSLACCTPYITRHRAFYVANGKWAYTNNNLTLVLQRSIAISIIGTYELIGISMSFLTAYRLKMYGMRSKKNEKNLIFVTSLHILVDIVAMLIMIAEFLEWQFPLALFAVKNVFPVTYTVVILNSVTIILTNKRVRDAYIQTLKFWKKRVEDANSSSRQQTSIPVTLKLGNVVVF
ncbi:Serpentine receptor class gamma [Caenorhabditis elegans]|uniref:Serpentine receptor class gamma n=1 Tax=Caenorhabditis elegans TaxID=6239 RepID=Q4TT86_CAEEL|nr:Serpentine receptor class gamma [Caenorhabditis elegans]CCD71497.2 Serpentine receptor class gamma [Caenorhabditis elegans]|eukprot:NP_001022297.3 Uncharacterized protein CELE_T01D1.7 [Caenorhabditis elegans]